jgi:hypothetical protein
MNNATQQEIDEQVHKLHKLWAELFPDWARLSFGDRFRRWLETASLEICEYGLRRAYRKRYAANRQRNPMSPGQVRVYGQNVIEHEVVGDRAQSFVRDWGTPSENAAQQQDRVQ